MKLVFAVLTKRIIAAIVYLRRFFLELRHSLNYSTGLSLTLLID